VVPRWQLTHSTDLGIEILAAACVYLAKRCHAAMPPPESNRLMYFSDRDAVDLMSALSTLRYWESKR